MDGTHEFSTGLLSAAPSRVGHRHNRHGADPVPNMPAGHYARPGWCVGRPLPAPRWRRAQCSVRTPQVECCPVAASSPPSTAGRSNPTTDQTQQVAVRFPIFIWPTIASRSHHRTQSVTNQFHPPCESIRFRCGSADVFLTDQACRVVDARSSHQLALLQGRSPKDE